VACITSDFGMKLYLYKSCSDGRFKSLAWPLFPRAKTQAANVHHRATFVAFAAQQMSRRRDQVGVTLCADAQFAAKEVKLAAQVNQSGHARHADRHADVAHAKRAPVRVAEDDGYLRAGGYCKFFTDPCRTGVGVSGSSSTSWRLSPTLDWSMPALALTKPSRCWVTRTPGTARDTWAALTQHQLNDAWILACNVSQYAALHLQAGLCSGLGGGPRLWRRSWTKSPAHHPTGD
jgi:hypothetical protein